jgi:hypothetical protein
MWEQELVGLTVNVITGTCRPNSKCDEAYQIINLFLIFCKDQQILYSRKLSNGESFGVSGHSNDKQYI